MGAGAAVKLREVVLNTRRVLAIELFNSAQALDFRRPEKSSDIIEGLYARFRKKVPFIRDDEVMSGHIAVSIDFIKNELV